MVANTQLLVVGMDFQLRTKAIVNIALHARRRCSRSRDDHLCMEPHHCGGTPLIDAFCSAVHYFLKAPDVSPFALVGEDDRETSHQLMVVIIAIICIGGSSFTGDVDFHLCTSFLCEVNYGKFLANCIEMGRIRPASLLSQCHGHGPDGCKPCGLLSQCDV